MKIPFCAKFSDLYIHLQVGTILVLVKSKKLFKLRNGGPNYEYTN